MLMHVLFLPAKTVNCGFPTAPRNGYTRVSCSAIDCWTTHWCRDGYSLYGNRVRIAKAVDSGLVLSLLASTLLTIISNL